MYSYSGYAQNASFTQQVPGQYGSGGPIASITGNPSGQYNQGVAQGISDTSALVLLGVGGFILWGLLKR